MCHSLRLSGGAGKVQEFSQRKTENPIASRVLAARK